MHLINISFQPSPLPSFSECGRTAAPGFTRSSDALVLSVDRQNKANEIAFDIEATNLMKKKRRRRPRTEQSGGFSSFLGDVCRAAGPAACELMSMAAVKTGGFRLGRDVGEDDKDDLAEEERVGEEDAQQASADQKTKPQLEPMGLLRKKLNNER